MPLPPGSRPIPLCVSCPEQETVAFLKSALVAQLASKSPPIHVKEKNLLVCGVAWSRVESIYEDKQPLNGIERRSAILRIYELPRNAYDMRMHPLPPILLDSKASKAPDVSKEVSEASDLSKDKNEDQTKWEDKYVQIPVAHATRVEHDSFEKAGMQFHMSAHAHTRTCSFFKLNGG